MLERATACLKAGARDSLRCAKHSPRSQRMLHSTFWTHGAGDLDLPPWAVHMPASAIALAAHDDSPSSTSQRSRRQAIGAPNFVPFDGLFLDFLYPPQALAWLHRSGGQQLERWERRNARRLPEGFIHASRRYSSRSYTHDTSAPEEAGDEEEQAPPQQEHEHTLETSFEPLTEDTSGRDSSSNYGAFGDSPGDLADLSPPSQEPSSFPAVDAFNSLRAILSRGRRFVEEDVVKQAWSLYKRLDEDDRSKPLLRKELLLWLNTQDTELASAYCISLYWSLPLEERSLEVYEAALSAFLRRGDWDHANGLQKEALGNIANGATVTKTLFLSALRKREWLWALRTSTLHYKHFSGPRGGSQRATLWFHVAELPDLPDIADSLLQQCQAWESTSEHPEDLPDLYILATKLIEEALLQLAREPMTVPHSNRVVRRGFPAITRMTDALVQRHRRAISILHEAIWGVLRQSEQNSTYAIAHPIVSIMYEAVRRISGAFPPARLLSLFLERLKYYWDVKSPNPHSGISLSRVFEDWIHFHGRVNLSGVAIMISYHARHGSLKGVERYTRYAKETYPAYEEYKRILWASVYVHARRADLASATKAFEEIEAIAKAQQDQPDDRSWAALLYAHSRADDLEGALVVLERYLATGLLVSTPIVVPITEMQAQRGDIEGIERILELLPPGSEGPRFQISRINALVASDRVGDAKKLLEDLVDNLGLNSSEQKLGFTDGKMLTTCCNILITAYASRGDLDSTMRMYSFMRSHSIAMNPRTYSAFMQALVNHRQTGAARRVMTHIMVREKLKPTSLHFAILINGFMREKDYLQAVLQYKEMRRKRLQPTIATTRAYLRAVRYHQREKKDGQERMGHLWRKYAENQLPSFTSSALIKKSMAAYNSKAMAEKGIAIGLDRTSPTNRLNEYVDYAMHVEGMAANIQEVAQLFLMYQNEMKKRGLSTEQTPMRMLTALITAHLHAGKYDMVEAYWKMAKDQADRFAPDTPVADFRQTTTSVATTADPFAIAAPGAPPPPNNEADAAEVGFSPTGTTESRSIQITPPKPHTTPYGPRPSAGRNTILSRPLHYYLRALLCQNRINDMITTVTQLLAQGYRFDGTTWNRFIEYLCNAPDPPLLLAFILTERYLMPNFPGWLPGGHPLKKPKKGARVLGLQYMAKRYEARRTLAPQYRTFRYLARGLMILQREEVRRGEKRGNQLRGTVKVIRQRAPKTVEALEAMPRRDADKWQRRAFRDFRRRE